MGGPIKDGADAPLGVVLAGGLARRLGGAKATVQLAGRPLICYPLKALSAAGLEAVVIAKSDTPLPELEVQIWVEEPSRQHPAHGIATALDRAARPLVVCACDTPFLPPPLLALLANRDRPLVALESARGIEPLPGRYAPALGESLAAAATRGEALHATVARLEPDRLTEAELRRYGDPARTMLNINAPPDLERAEAILRDRSSATSSSVRRSTS